MISEREKAISLYFKALHNKEPRKARNFIKKTDYKTDHYLLYCIANTYWEEERLSNNRLRLAERYVTKAFEINPNCPYVLWLLALVKWKYGQMDAAQYSYEDIIRLGEKRLMKEGCNIDLSVVRAQINDSKFELYLLHKKTNESKANKYLRQFEDGLRKGIFTVIEYKCLKEENVLKGKIPKNQIIDKW